MKYMFLMILLLTRVMLGQGQANDPLEQGNQRDIHSAIRRPA